MNNTTTFIRTMSLALVVVAGTCCLEGSKEAKEIKRVMKINKNFNTLLSNKDCYKVYAEQNFNKKNVLQTLEKTWQQVNNCKEEGGEVLILDGLSDEIQDETISFTLKVISEMLPDIQKISLRNNNVTIIPSTLSCFKKLKSLNLSNNRIKSTNNIEMLENLEELYLDNNVLSKISKDLASLKNLTILSLSNNNFGKKPSEIFGKKPSEISKKTTYLKSGKITYTYLSRLSQLTNLEVLLLDNNWIDAIPKSFESLKNLKILHLNNNNITNFPFWISSLSKIEIVNLESNKIKEINITKNFPIYIEHMGETPYSFENLKVFNVKNNPISKKTAHIAELTRHIRQLKI